MNRILNWFGRCVLIILAGGLGGWTGSLIGNKQYPIQMLERVVMTPQVAPGADILIAQHVNRIDQCDVVVKRTITTATGQRFTIKQEFEEGFGPLGGDRYLLPVPTPTNAAFGPAKMYSKAQSYCNWLDYVKPSEAENWTMDFRFAEETVHVSTPPGFADIGIKDPTNHRHPQENLR